MQFPQSVLSLLEQDGQLVTANARSAIDFRRLYNDHQLRRAGRQAWASAAIHDWQSWLKDQWQQVLLTGAETRLLLSRLQEEALWAAIIRREVEARTLISRHEVARLAHGAWELLAAYGGLPKLQQGAWGSVDSGADGSASVNLREPELFRRWAVEFERRCQRSGWLSHSMLPWVIAQALSKGLLQTPSSVMWNGFDRLTPADAAVRDALAHAGCRQSDMTMGVSAAAHCTTLPTFDAELEACALWARDMLQEDPSARIGVLVRNLPEARAELDRTFRRILTPASEGLRSAAEKPVYEFTLGMPLDDVPMVRAALLLLRWIARPIERDQVSWLLTTRFFAVSGGEATMAAAGAWLQQVELLPNEIGLDQLLKLLGTRSHFDVAQGQWTAAVQRARAALAPLLPREHACRDWVHGVVTALADAGWPGTRNGAGIVTGNEDSVSFQVRKRWHEILEGVASLDFTETRLSYDAFLDHLSSHAQSSLFTAESEDAPVSVSGVLESAGRAYDAVWVLQASDEAWPIRSSAHCMLPLWLQAELDLPRGDARRDLAFSLTVLERLHGSTAQLVFSCARESTAGAQRPSPLLQHLPERLVTSAPAPTHADLSEAFEDVAAIAWPAGPREAGGAETLRLQAACPFRAFATRRLGAREQATTAQGFDARERGNLLHSILQALWTDPLLTGSADLNALVASGALAECIRRHVDDSTSKYHRDVSGWNDAYLRLERMRLAELVHSWMKVEILRPPFVVESVEQKKKVTVNGLHLNIRLDRVDRLLGEKGDERNVEANGEGNGEARILLDYKSGKVNASGWVGPRMDEPQLPLYAAFGGVDELQDVFFAQLRVGEALIKGSTAAGQALVSNTPPQTPTTNAEDDFPARVSQWAEWLVETAQEFQHGVARVDPKRPKTCEYCPLGGLCRVAETRQGLVLLDEEDEA